LAKDQAILKNPKIKYSLSFRTPRFSSRRRNLSLLNRGAPASFCPATFRRHRKIAPKLQNSIDTSFIVPQYLGLEGLAVLRIGLVFQATGPQSKSRKGNRSTEESFMATKKKAKKKKH
jgi:hypothetical protein